MAAHDIIMAAAGGSTAANYIEDVFSTYLYTGNESTQTITNGIDLSGKGGLVILKGRSGTYGADWWGWNDTSRGVSSTIFSNATDAAINSSDWNLSSFNVDGFSLDPMGTNGYAFNNSATKYASWTFRKQPKFFDVVTWTGDGTNPRQISHNLGSVPGCIIIKSTTRAENWTVYHTSLGNTGRIALNTTAAAVTGTGVWASTTPTSTYFTVSADNLVNFSGDGYVAYIFAHNAGGFGLTGTDNVISCGSVTNTAQQVDLGYEPQWIMYKTIGGTTGAWNIFDNMRGMTADGSGAYLRANTASAEAIASGQPTPNATGFYWSAGTGQTCIYIAIRRGPMKVPTDATKVFSPQIAAGVQTTNFVVDSNINVSNRSSPNISVDPNTRSRLIGAPYLTTSSTAAETGTTSIGFDSNTGVTYSWPSGGVNWYFRRAPSFFDEVCYTGGSSPPNTFSHNLGVAPELMIIKSRNNAYAWFVYSQAVGVAPHLRLNTTDAATTGTAYLSAAPDANNFYLNGTALCNNTGDIYVAYLFATCAGVSKVGSYTGTGATQTISCGFTGGARFVLIKKTSGTGDWYVWDTARGMVSGTDPNLQLNTTNAETNTNSIYTTTGGFQIVSTAAGINASGGTYIFLAIA